MGHTVSGSRVVSDFVLEELRSYGRALRQYDRQVYENVLKQAFKHYGTISYASSIHAWAFLLLSILLEQEKRIKQLENESLADRRLQEQELHYSVD
jgi:hypothetical protein